MIEALTEVPLAQSHRRWWWLSPIVAVGVAALFLAGYWPRHEAQAKLATNARAVVGHLPRVKVVTVALADSGRSLTLPGTLAADQQAFVYARATGYVARLHVDIGDRVHAGDVLADLDTPELAQQLAQARAAVKQKDAAVDQSIASRDYMRLTAERSRALLREALVAKQEDDQAQAQLKIGEANVRAAQADVSAAQANVRQLVQLVSFGHVIAPFDGRITQRNIDVGSLVTAGTTGGGAATQPLFRIESTEPMRVFVHVPQVFAPSVALGEAGSVAVRQLPGRVFDGHVTRTAGTIDPASRTLDVELDVPNPEGDLLAGMFVEATIAVAVSHPVVRVPASAVMTDSRGVHVATVDGDGLVRLVAVTCGIDGGRDIEIVAGLDGGERVIVSPGAGVTDGMHVDALSGA